MAFTKRIQHRGRGLEKTHDIEHRQTALIMYQDDMAPLTQLFDLLNMPDAVAITVFLEEDKDVDLTAAACNRIVEKWSEYTAAQREIAAMIGLGVASGVLMQIPQDYDAKSDFYGEWLERQLVDWQMPIRVRVGEAAKELLKEATRLVSFVNEAPDGGIIGWAVSEFGEYSQCPSCEELFDEGRGALSRFDNRTKICSPCGTYEGLAQFAAFSMGVDPKKVLVGVGDVAEDFSEHVMLY